ncbi:hypothetical protein KEM54_000219 [Ascosphaera aggregata]|nr:hypothetical protein KEM54_000219 [Ascosphaera aggregata]
MLATPVTSDCLFGANAKPQRMRTAASKRVYGKRQADAPKAVFNDQDRTTRWQITAKDAVSSRQRTWKFASNELHHHDEVEALRAELETITITDETGIANEGGVPTKGDSSTHLSSTSKAYPLREEISVINSLVQQRVRNADEPSEKALQPSMETASNLTSVATTLVDVDAERWSSALNKQAAESLVQSIASPCRLSGIIQDPELTSYVSPILSQASSPLASAGIQSFQSWSERSSSRYFTVAKIAEGSYGEVYQLKLRKDVLKAEATKLSKAKIAKIRTYKNVIFKIVPLRAKKGAGSRKFTSVKDLTSELKLMKVLDRIPGFARFREVHVVQGRFPKTYQDAWDLYARNKPEECLNPDPKKKASFPDGQLWAILEMDDAGAELEKRLFAGMIKSAFEIYDIFWGVCMGLARGEGALNFEHRDLHLGNICIKFGRSKVMTLPKLDLDNEDALLTGFGLSGIETSIIDFSLSRAELKTGEEHGNGAESDVEIAWCNLDERGIFDAEGEDEDDQLLRDTYRHMKYQVYLDDPTNGNTGPVVPEKWAESHCGTNVVWLRFLNKMLLRKCGEIDYKILLGGTSSNSTSSGDAPRKVLAERSANTQPTNNRASKTGKKMRAFTGTQTADLTVEDTSNDARSVIQTWQEGLIGRLEVMDSMLDFDSEGYSDFRSAGDIVAFAIGAGWLDEGDYLRA